jgi:hypothetical protein
MAKKSSHSICRWTFNPGKGSFVPGDICIVKWAYGVCTFVSYIHHNVWTKNTTGQILP